MCVLQMVITPTQHAWPSKPFHAARIKATPMTSSDALFRQATTCLGRSHEKSH